MTIPIGRIASSTTRNVGALALAAVLVLMVLTEEAHAGRLITGLTNLDTNAPLAFERTRSAGAQFVRIQLYWAGAVPEEEPTAWRPDDPNDPAYDWGRSDDAVRQAVAAGLTPVLHVDGAPRWAQRCSKPASIGGSNLCDPDPAALGSFAIAAARRYSGQTPNVPHVRYWQALNEPNLSLFFFPQYDTAGNALSPEFYRALINAFHDGIKTVDPSNVVVLAGLGPIAVPPWTIGPMRFARQLLCMRGHRRPRPTKGDCGGGVRFDIFAIQPYTTGSPVHQGKINDVQLGDLEKLQTLIRAADRAGRIKSQFNHTPLWITEFSWDSRPPDPGGLPMKIEKQWVAEALYQAWRAGVTHFFWYTLRDGHRDRGTSYADARESGLYFRGATIDQDRPKPVLDVFRFPFVAFARKQGLSFWGRTPNSKGGKVIIQLRRNGRWRRAGKARANRAGIFRGLLRGNRYGSNKRGQARAIHARRQSRAFPMRRVPDFRHAPFGGPVG